MLEGAIRAEGFRAELSRETLGWEEIFGREESG